MPIGLPADAATLRKHSTWFAIYGAVMIALGCFAIMAPAAATLAVELTIGWMLLFGGAIGLAAVISSGRAVPGFWWNLFTAIICVLAGLSLLTRPMAGIVTLTIIFAAYLMAGGIVRVILAIGYRKEIPTAWGWMMLSAIVDIALALIVISGMPGTATWVLGLLVGINLLMMGFAVVMTAVAVRKATAAT